MAIAAAPPMQAAAVAFRERLLLVVLYVTVLASSFVFIEPSPHDALMGVLAVCCLVVGVRFERKFALLFLLLLVWNVAGLMGLLNVSTEEKAFQFTATSLNLTEEKAIQFTATSFYLAVTAVLFACLFAQNTMPRLATMRAAYVLTATVVSLASIAGYFDLFPGAYELFAPGGRALGAFKDPNVFGPFLIWPILIVLERMVARHVRITDIMIVGILLFGLLLSFSRGAWFHFGVSCAIMLALTFLTAPTQRARMRIFALSAIGVVALAAIVAILLSFDSIAKMFQERAQLIQSYDVGQGGRFRLQELALSALFNFPNGLGPFEFSRIYGQQQHNQYLQAFMVYGWTGGIAYLMLMLSTICVALRTVLVPTPWQPYLIAAFGAFVGEALEGFVIDTDHWRHFYLLLGMVWGLAAATLHQKRRSYAPIPHA